MSSQSAKYDAASATIFSTRTGGLPITSVGTNSPGPRVSSSAAFTIALASATSMTITATGAFSDANWATSNKLVLTGGPNVLTYPTTGGTAYSLLYVPLIYNKTSNDVLTVTIPTAPGSLTSGNFTNVASIVIDAFQGGDPLYITLNHSNPDLTIAPGTTFTLSAAAGGVTGSASGVSNLSKLTATFSVGSSGPGFFNLVTRHISIGATSSTITGSSLTINSTSAIVTQPGSGYSVGDSFVFSASVFGVDLKTKPNFNITALVTATTDTTGIQTLSISTPLDTNIPANVLLQGNKDYGFGFRDASDITRALKERIIYNEKRAGSPINSGKGGSLVFGRPGVNPGSENNIPAGNAEMLWIPQGNQYRLSYLFGKLKCGAGSAGAFNLNGPIQQS